ncbi:MAG TPA: FAD-binding oxidoreductase [Actinomycetota bacterium]|nr:FAD-binding oxidoreductase [Actinomycetota bacterium]
MAAFRDAFSGEVVLPEDAGYDRARAVWNGMIDRSPALVARCADVDDVRRTVRLARDQDLPLAVRCGGHSLAGFSTCDDGIVLDLSPLRDVRVDPGRRSARVAGGTLLSQLDEAAQAHGLVCPVGVVGHTGVAGLTLGGGMGRLQRHFGFSIDNLRSVELVTADDRVLTVSEDEEPELFWGIRGAGANFGVVTSFDFTLHEMGPEVTQGIALFPAERAREIAARVREYLETAPDEVMVSFGTTMATEEDGEDLAGRPVVFVGATHSGAVDEAAAVLRPLRDTQPLLDTFRQVSYVRLQTSGDEDMGWGKRFYMKGAFLAELSDAFVDAAVAHASTPRGAVTLWAHGGAISRVPEGAMAFTGREAAFWIGVEAEWDDAAEDEAMVDWGRTTMAALEPFTAAGHYVNDVIETGPGIVRGVYGDEKYERLLTLKRAFDPDNVFRLNQNIEP